MTQVLYGILIMQLVITMIDGMVFWRKPAIRQRVFANWLISMFFPIGGILVVLMLEYYHSEQLMEMPNPGLEADRIEDYSIATVKPIDVRSETNIAPLQDILLIADYDRRREAILDILKTDVLANAKNIQIALHNEDTETVHYAASGLQHIRQKLDARLHELSSLHVADPQNPQIATAYADLLDQYLNAFKLDAATQQQYLHISIEILSHLDQPPDLNRISRLIEHLLTIGQYQQARQFCSKLMLEYPDSETKYLVLLKSFFMMRDKTHFEQVLDQFRSSDICFSDEALNIIRLWLGAIK